MKSGGFCEKHCGFHEKRGSFREKHCSFHEKRISKDHLQGIVTVCLFPWLSAYHKSAATYLWTGSAATATFSGLVVFSNAILLCYFDLNFSNS